MPSLPLSSSLSNAAPFSALRRLSSWICILLLLVLANGVLRNEVPRQTPDETIPVSVIRHMHATASLDTDWNDVPVFPSYFKRVHFNFSGYIMAADAFVSFTGTAPDSAGLLDQLRLFSRLSTLALLLVVFLFARRLWGNGYALLAAWATLSAPVLFQDAHYARPEAFGTLLFTCCMAIAGCKGNAHWNVLRLVLIAAISGYLASIKVTYVSAAVFGIPIWLQRPVPAGKGASDWRRASGEILVAAVVFVAAFFAGAPHVAADPDAFLAGLQALSSQYGGAHPPHSHPEYHFLSQIGWIGGYFALTIGWLALPFHALGYFNLRSERSKRAGLLAYLAIGVLTLLVFAHEHVFFERNFSHLVPGFLIIAAGGLKFVVAAVAELLPLSGAPSALARAAMAVALFALWQITPVKVSRELHRTFSSRGVLADERKAQLLVARAEKSAGATKVEQVDFPAVFRGTLGKEQRACVLYDITTYGDPWSARFIGRLPPTFRVAGLIPSLFSGIPTSTLQTYQSATRYLVYDTKFCHASHE